LPGGEIIHHSSPADSSPGTEDSFEIEVLREPFPVTHNIGFESSMRNRILAMENANSIFLLDKDRGVYWAEIKESLDNCSSQKEYNRLLEFENRDLQIRERKHECYSIFQEVLAQHPALAENAAYNPEESCKDFFDENRDDIEEELSPAQIDKKELQF
jgi:hypothetical protein